MLSFVVSTASQPNCSCSFSYSCFTSRTASGTTFVPAPSLYFYGSSKNPNCFRLQILLYTVLHAAFHASALFVSLCYSQYLHFLYSLITEDTVFLFLLYKTLRLFPQAFYHFTAHKTDFLIFDIPFLFLMSAIQILFDYKAPHH